MARLPKTLEDLIQHFSRLPGIGPKSAARLAFFLLQSEESDLEKFSETLGSVKSDIKTCERCFHISETEECEICKDTSRNTHLICVVEEPLDVIAIENAGGYQGRYHVLGGAISPLHGKGPEDLKMAELFQKAREKEIEEVILATNANVEGEATAMYIAKELEPLGIQTTRLAGGLPFGSDLEYTDEMTLAQAIANRRSYKKE